jgi:ATP-dependent DNA helicase PIF1
MTQQEALNVLKTGANVFLTGSPGSGKTYTVRAYIDWLRSHGIDPSITASTGVAATHIHGLTLHAWSGIGITDVFTSFEIDRIAGKEHVAKRIQRTSILIIDEVSMLSGTILDAVDMICRQVRGNDLAFGGIQVVLVGDFFQLPPIAGRGRPVSFAFESQAWRALHIVTCYLTEQHRQDDGVFLSLLSAIRAGTFSEDESEVLQERFVEMKEVPLEIPRLYTHNVDVDTLNNSQLAALPGASHVFSMEQGGTAALVEGLKRGCLSPEKLALKEGAVVMCTKNNPQLGYANGTLGKVVSFDEDTTYPCIELSDGRVVMLSPSDWVVEDEGKIRASITQIPLRLAWAVTVHKSQGQSMDAAAMDLSRAFEYGQGYVALSRVRTIEGLYLSGWSARALAIHPQVVRHDAHFQAASEAAEERFAELDESGERQIMEEQFIRAAGGSIEVLTPSERKAGVGKTSTYDETARLLSEGMSLADIAKGRELTLGTICDHVDTLLSLKRITQEEASKLLSAKLRSHLPEIEKSFRSLGFERLAPVHGELGGAFTYDDLKLARAVIRNTSR